MNKSVFICLFLSCSFWMFLNAQQDPQYTQYMYNMAQINPAYAGTNERLTVTGMYRRQWSGFDNAPETLTLGIHTPLSEKIGVGLSVIEDQLGPVQETNAHIDFSYVINLGYDYNLAFGLKAGAAFHNVGLSDLETIDPNDPLFAENINNIYPRAGLGVYLYRDFYYLGLSVPNILSSVHLDENGIQYGSETNHFFFTGGYVWDATWDWKIKPSFLVKSSFGAPVSFDLNLNTLYKEKFELGVSYRLDDSFSGLVGFYLAPNVRIGYAYDQVISDLNGVSSSSHEIVLQFDIVRFKYRDVKRVRFF
ncbi:PorP/SprF family type IX secretion system membrane protein [Altibacter sp. HG106]|uniref:PorP/SprF family type IX secretion system membrane protein n=1 Tax=Altibacter sp. HG106 TaxID=3023937 RepID=UPI002350889E|nr:type IX secretion system membrane protein PorP/SprF [Altibacter sp. HG106]MDC7995137.1 type IX secretion system membrane protein PorP/SprF [Altibacter sp. HG106]